MTTKILALSDALGNLAHFVLMPGHRFDTIGVAPLIEGIDFGGLIADQIKTIGLERTRKWVPPWPSPVGWTIAPNSVAERMI